MILSSFYFQRSNQVSTVLIVQQNNSVDNSFDAISSSVELLFSSNKLLVCNSKLVVLWLKHKFKPLSYVPYSSTAIFKNLFVFFAKTVELNKLSANSNLYCPFKFILAEIHFLEYVLEDLVNNIS